jgi:ABC-type uncharacterized transport system involved in gliding motility auxiliary subunit
MKFLLHALKTALLTLAMLSAVGGLAYLTQRYPLQLDLTANANNSLSEASQKLLASLPEPIEMTAYLKKSQPVRLQIAQLIDRYRRHKPNVRLQFIDPEEQPEKARELELSPEGAVIVTYQGRSEKLSFIDEVSLSNALLHLASSEPRWISFLAGHGERSPNGEANFDLGLFAKELARRNLKSLTINLTQLAEIPANAALLVIAAPAVPLLPEEIGIIKRYIEQGDNLLVLAEPNNSNLTEILQTLGLRLLSGSIIAANTKLYGINNPNFVIANHYPSHSITRGLQLITLYPEVAALVNQTDSGFHSQILLSADSSEDPALNIPQTFGLSLSRNTNKTSEQRIVVMGDSDFLSNTYLGNVGNLDMGVRIINWLLHDDRFIDIPAKVASDKQLVLTQTAVTLIGFGFLIALPFILLVSGLIVWRWRKRR